MRGDLAEPDRENPHNQSLHRPRKEPRAGELIRFIIYYLRLPSVEMAKGSGGRA